MVQAVETQGQGTTEPEARIKDKTMATTLIGAHGLEHFYGHSFPVLVTAMYASLGMDPVMAGVLSTVRQITSGVTSVSSGFFVDIFRYRSGQVLAASMGLIGIGYLLVSISPNYYAVLGALNCGLRWERTLASPSLRIARPAVPTATRIVHLPSPSYR